MVEWAVQLYTREWNTEELSIPVGMKAPYMRIVFLPDVFTKAYGDVDQLMIDMLEEFKFSIFINSVQGRLIVRVSAQIFSTKAEYLYVAKMIKKRTKELEAKFA